MFREVVFFAQGNPDVSEAVFRLLKAAREGKRQQEEVRVAAPDGSHGRWLRMRVRPLGTGKREGKSTVGTALAQLISHSGAKTILVDCNFRHSSLSRMITPNAKVGILEVISGAADLDEDLARLFEGHAGYICDECVDVCVLLLHDYREMGLRPPKHDQPWYRKLLGDNGGPVSECSFNLHDRANPQGVRIFPGINAQICDKCIRACEVLKSSLVLGD